MATTKATRTLAPSPYRKTTPCTIQRNPPEPSGPFHELGVKPGDLPYILQRSIDEANPPTFTQIPVASWFGEDGPQPAIAYKVSWGPEVDTQNDFHEYRIRVVLTPTLESSEIGVVMVKETGQLLLVEWDDKQLRLFGPMGFMEPDKVTVQGRVDCESVAMCPEQVAGHEKTESTTQAHRPNSGPESTPPITNETTGPMTEQARRDFLLSISSATAGQLPEWPEEWPYKDMANHGDGYGDHFVWCASQMNTDLAAAAHLELLGYGGVEAHDYDALMAPMFWKLRQSFIDMAMRDDKRAFAEAIDRAYTAGRLSPERLDLEEYLELAKQQQQLERNERISRAQKPAA